LAIIADLAGVPLQAKRWTPREKREHRQDLVNLELLQHFRMIEGYPEREQDRAAVALRAKCKADPGFLAWLADDLEQARQICALIVGLLTISQEKERAQKDDAA
jgi:hypothetical protein